MFRLDEKFKNHKKKYFFQSVLVVVILSFIFSFLNFIFDISIVAALGASAFITFTAPFDELTRARYLIGGYIVGCFSAFLLSGLNFYLINYFFVGIPIGILGALAVGISMFFMVIFDFEHPPAAGVALGLIMDGCNLESAFIAVVGVIFFVIVRKLFSKYLIDLL